MKVLAAISAALLFLFLTVSTPAFSQDDKDRTAQQDGKAKDKNHDNDKKDNSKEQPRRDERDARQDQRHDDARQENRDNHQGDRDHTNNNVQQQPESRHGSEVDRDHDQHRVDSRRVEHIPDGQFRASFGRQHRFHVDRASVYGQPQPIVVYGGYSFELVNAWPSDWSFDDDCYIDYDDGQYWLFNANRPGLRIEVIVMD
jgi:hypothetical protein